MPSTELLIFETANVNKALRALKYAAPTVPSWWNSETHRGYDEIEFRVSREGEDVYVSETLLVYVKPQNDFPTVTFDGAILHEQDPVTPDQLSLAIKTVPTIELEEDVEKWIQGLRVRDVDTMFQNSGESLIRVDLEASNGTISIVNAQTRFAHDEPFMFESLGVSEVHEGTGTHDVRISFTSSVQDANAVRGVRAWSSRI